MVTRITRDADGQELVSRDPLPPSEQIRGRNSVVSRRPGRNSPTTLLSCPQVLPVPLFG